MDPNFVPPPGPPVTRVAEINGVAISMTVCVAIFVPLRFWVRGAMVGKVGPDDWCIGVATILSILLNVLVMVSTHYGAGQHFWNLEADEMAEGLKYNYLTQILTVPCLAMVKVSIGLFLLRLAASKLYRHVCVGFIVIMSTYSFASALTIIFQCYPVRAIWDVSTPNANCMSTQVRLGLGYSYSIVTIISDFFLVVLPIAMLWHVQIPRRQRFMICGILSVGTFAASASIVKCLYVVNFGRTGDFLWDSSDVCMWTMIEVNVGILSASLPALKPLFKRVMNKALYSSERSRTRGLSNSRGHQLSSINKSGVARPDPQNGISNDIRAGSAHTILYGQRVRLPDSESEEGIFGISKRTEVSVDVETISTSSGEGGVGGIGGIGVIRDDRAPASAAASHVLY